jgi:ankyrin repeat protein
VNERDEDGQTLLMTAILSSKWSIANYLIDNARADVTLLSPDNYSIYTLLDFAFDHGSTERLELKKKLQVFFLSPAHKLSMVCC